MQAASPAELDRRRLDRPPPWRAGPAHPGHPARVPGMQMPGWCAGTAWQGPRGRAGAGRQHLGTHRPAPPLTRRTICDTPRRSIVCSASQPLAAPAALSRTAGGHPRSCVGRQRSAMRSAVRLQVLPGPRLWGCRPTVLHEEMSWSLKVGRAPKWSAACYIELAVTIAIPEQRLPSRSSLQPRPLLPNPLQPHLPRRLATSQAHHGSLQWPGMQQQRQRAAEAIAQRRSAGGRRHRAASAAQPGTQP